MAKKQKPFEGHWSETPGLRRWLRACEDGWREAELTQYSSPADAFDNLKIEELYSLLDIMHGKEVRKFFEMVDLLEDFNVRPFKDAGTIRDILERSGATDVFFTRLYKRFPNLKPL